MGTKTRFACLLFAVAIGFSLPARADTDCVKLAEALKDEYQFSSRQELTTAYSQLVSMDETQLINDFDSGKFNAGASIPLPMVKGFVSFLKATISNETEHKKYEEFKKQFLESKQSTLSEEQLLYFTERSLKKEAFDLLKSCVESQNSTSFTGVPGLRAKWIGGDSVVAGNISPMLLVEYVRVPLGPEAVSIEGVDFQADRIDWKGNHPAFPMTMENGGSASLHLTRSGSVENGFPEATLLIHVKGAGVVQITLPEIAKFTALPAVVFKPLPPKIEKKEIVKADTNFIVKLEHTGGDTKFGNAHNIFVRQSAKYELTGEKKDSVVLTITGGLYEADEDGHPSGDGTKFEGSKQFPIASFPGSTVKLPEHTEQLLVYYILVLQGGQGLDVSAAMNGDVNAIPSPLFRHLTELTRAKSTNTKVIKGTASGIDLISRAWMEPFTVEVTTPQ